MVLAHLSYEGAFPDVVERVVFNLFLGANPRMPNFNLKYYVKNMLTRIEILLPGPTHNPVQLAYEPTALHQQLQTCGPGYLIGFQMWPKRKSN